MGDQDLSQKRERERGGFTEGALFKNLSNAIHALFFS